MGLALRSAGGSSALVRLGSDEVGHESNGEFFKG